MISIEDCIAFSGLTRDEVFAIAEHEHSGFVAAATLGRYLISDKAGADAIRAMIVNDIRAARQAGDDCHAHELFLVLRQFLHDFPHARMNVAGVAASTR